jgi:hypothetical protein
MLARTHRVLCAAALATIGATACAPVSANSGRESRYASSAPPLSPTSRVIDAARIARSGSQSALDAVRAFVPIHRLTDVGPVTAPWDASSTLSRGILRVVVDGHPIADLESLRMIPAREIVAIHVLSAPDATIHFGSSYHGGAVVIQTHASLRRLD